MNSHGTLPTHNDEVRMGIKTGGITGTNLLIDDDIILGKSIELFAITYNPDLERQIRISQDQPYGDIEGVCTEIFTDLIKNLHAFIYEIAGISDEEKRKLFERIKEGVHTMILLDMALLEYRTHNGSQEIRSEQILLMKFMRQITKEFFPNPDKPGRPLGEKYVRFVKHLLDGDEASQNILDASREKRACPAFHTEAGRRLVKNVIELAMRRTGIYREVTPTSEKKCPFHHN